MTSFHLVEPEVAGGWGENTDATRLPGRPPVVNKLHYVFDGWLGDDLLESTSCFIVSQRLARGIEQAKLTGTRFDRVEISKSEQFDDDSPGVELPEFMWLKVQGSPGHDDFGVTSDLRLVEP